MSISTDQTPPLSAEKVLPILLTALETSAQWWYGRDDPKVVGDAFKLKARAVRAAVEQAIVIGRQAMRGRV